MTYVLFVDTTKINGEIQCFVEHLDNTSVVGIGMCFLLKLSQIAVQVSSTIFLTAVQVWIKGRAIRAASRGAKL